MIEIENRGGADAYNSWTFLTFTLTLEFHNRECTLKLSPATKDYRARRRCIRRAGVVILLAAAALAQLASGSALAQERRESGRQAGRAAARPDGLPVEPFFDDFNEWLESDLVAHMKQRATTSPDLVPRLELQIDLRVVARWLLAESAKAPAGSELQCCTYLRAIHVLGAAAHVAAHTQRAGKPTPPQADAMAKLHDLTFRLPDSASVKQADDLCKNIAALLVTASGPLPAGLKELPLMRPPAPQAERTVRDGSPTLAELSERVKNMGVSPGLRQQLIELSQAAERAEKAAKGPAPRDPRLPPGAKAPDPSPAQPADAAALVEMLERAVALADALQKGLAVGDQARAKMESQLAEGLVLFTDPRLRASGVKRVSALDQYRRTVERIRRLNLTPAMQKRLAPAFVYAQENADQGPKVIEALETYLDLCARHDARPNANTAAQNGKAGEREAKLLEELARQFTAHRTEFIETAAGLGGASGADTPGGPEALGQLLARMRTTLHLETTVEKAPRALQLLNTYRPKPFGGLEKRVTVSLVALTDPKPSLAKDDAEKFLPELVALAGYAGELAGPAGDAPAEGGATAAGIPADVVKAYTRGKLNAFETKCRELISDQVNQLASGNALEPAKIARLDAARALGAALREAADLEGALRRADVLTRWADWSLDAATLRAVLTPYREALASSYEAFASDTAAPATSATVRARYAPVIDLLKDAARRADACAALPGGVAGELSKLMTPLNNAPFADERYASLGLTLWGRYEQATDAKNATAAADAVAARLKSSRQ